MNNFRFLTYLSMFFLTLSCAENHFTCAPDKIVFPTTDTLSVPYRIPAIGVANDGTLVAVADYRYSREDIGNGRLDLAISTSSDDGHTWSESCVLDVMRGDGLMESGHQKAAFGDPCIVGDVDSPRMMITSCSGFPNFFRGTREQHQGWARWYSYDNGKSWSEPSYLDEQFVYQRFDHSKYGPIKGWFVASGKISQSRIVKIKDYYRLYCAGSSWNGIETANWVLFSDDFGESWDFLGECDSSPVPGGDEPKVEELPDGNILISSRCVGGRRFNIFTFADINNSSGRWAMDVKSGIDNNGVTALENGCNGELLLLPAIRKVDHAAVSILLQSVPFGPKRTNVGIYYKELISESDYESPTVIASNWDGRFQITELGSAYSTMVLQKNKTIGFLYEEETFCDTSGGGYSIVYKNLSLSQITNGLYEIRE